MMTPKILVFSGSVRGQSTNSKLAAVATKTLAQLDCEPTLITLADYELPIYDGDLEADSGVPENAVRLARLFHEHHGMIVASPEYNGSITPLLKNTIDWISRVSADIRGPVVPYRGKIAGMVATSPGQMGGVNSLNQLRPILSRLGMLVVSEQVSVGNSGTAFDEMGNLANAKSQEFLTMACQSVVEKASIFNLR